VPLLVLTTALPKPGSEGDQVLRSAAPALARDVVDLLDPAAGGRLAALAAG
jgi:hypothetical protein